MTPIDRIPDDPGDGGVVQTSQGGSAMKIPHQLSAVLEFAYQYSTAIALVMLAAALFVVLAVVTSWRRGRFTKLTARANAKLSIGTAIVQAGMTWAVVTGTYKFCDKYFHLDSLESGAFSVFFEAATWVTVGMIMDHGKEKKEGFGPAGKFFWLFSTLGGVLAILAGATPGEMIGRAVVVTFGVCLWFLTLLRKTRRSKKAGRFRWTPRNLLIRIGAIAEDEEDDSLAGVDRKRRVQAMTRAARAVHRKAFHANWPAIGAQARLDRLAMFADDAMMAEVSANVYRSFHATAQTDPDRAKAASAEGRHVSAERSANDRRNTANNSTERPAGASTGTAPALHGGSAERSANPSTEDAEAPQSVISVTRGGSTERFIVPSTEASIALRAPSTSTRGGSANTSTNAPRRNKPAGQKSRRKSAEQLLHERVKLVKDAFRLWEYELPTNSMMAEILSGTELATASEGVFTEIRKQLQADRAEMFAGSPVSPLNTGELPKISVEPASTEPSTEVQQ